MKHKNSKIAIAVACVVAFGLNIQWSMDGYGIKTGDVQVELLANGTESGTGTGSGGATGSGSAPAPQCPDYNYVPDEKLYVEVVEKPMLANSKGCITVKNEERSGYVKDTLNLVTLQSKDCVPPAPGACCDQRKIGLYWP